MRIRKLDNFCHRFVHYVLANQERVDQMVRLLRPKSQIWFASPISQVPSKSVGMLVPTHFCRPLTNFFSKWNSPEVVKANESSNDSIILYFFSVTLNILQKFSFQLFLNFNYSTFRYFMQLFLRFDLHNFIYRFLFLRKI